jgi:hypothetical protein
LLDLVLVRYSIKAALSGRPTAPSFTPTVGRESSKYVEASSINDHNRMISVGRHVTTTFISAIGCNRRLLEGVQSAEIIDNGRRRSV